ncbi:MAG: metallophosphoesterase [Eubacteriales bacterium]
MTIKITTYNIYLNQNIAATKIALVADLHNKPHDNVIAACKLNKPDFIAVAGDLMELLNRDESIDLENKIGFEFLKKAAAVSPTVYSLGNHEKKPGKTAAEKIKNTGAVFLDNSFATLGGIIFGGLSSGYSLGKIKTPFNPEPETAWLSDFAKKDGVKILLSHHPEYYKKYIKKYDIDLVLAGHAHGGQWRFFGRGVFAPGQGFFPKYTSGVYENRLVVSRGLAARNNLPRIFNPPELVFVNLYGNKPK